MLPSPNVDRLLGGGVLAGGAGHALLAESFLLFNGEEMLSV